jgi:hypothetical protein
MSDALDLLLEQTRETAPYDEDFVQNVMAGVNTYEQRRWSRRLSRRPIAFGVAAVVMVTGGTVAAVVGTNPSTPTEEATSAPRIVRATREPASSVTVSATPVRPSTAKPSAAAPVKERTEGFLTDHTAFILDAKTGLRLETETYTNDFKVGKDHRVTLTMENTGSKRIRFSAPKDCGLQVMAFPSDTNSAPVYQSPEEYTGPFEWVCAGSDGDPRAQPLNEEFTLAPGERRIADAYVSLDKPGEWKLAGMCKCSYSRMESVSSPKPKDDPLSELFGHALPSPLMPESSEGKDLVTPGIIVRSR